MSSTINESVAASCDYCGRENPDRFPNCTGCGTPLISAPPAIESEPKRKSKVLAVFLAVLFGPLGLLYVGAWWPAFVMIGIGVPFILTQTGGVWLSVVGRIICAVWAYCAVVEEDQDPNQRESAGLLAEAARLESTDRSQAIAAYEEIIRLYPDTPASR